MIVSRHISPIFHPHFPPNRSSAEDGDLSLDESNATGDLWFRVQAAGSIAGLLENLVTI
jgi:hypothetical protein